MKRIYKLIELTFFMMILVSCTSKQHLSIPQSSHSSGQATQNILSTKTIKNNLQVKDSQAGTLAIVDSGASNAVSKSIIYFKDFVNQEAKPYDDLDHGTAVTYLAENLLDSVKIVELKVLDQNDEVTPDRLMQALNWLVQNAQTYNIKVVNISLSITNFDAATFSEFQSLINQLHSENIVVVASSPNFSQAKSIPSSNQNVISVGNMSFQKTQSDIYTYGDNIESISPAGHKVIVNGTSFSSIIAASYILSKGGVTSNLPKILK